MSVSQRINRCHTTCVRHVGVALLSLASTVPQPALAAQPIPLDGVYGTPEGCEYYRTLDWNDEPNFFQIEEMALQTPVATCRFPRFDTSTADEIAGPVICKMAPQNDIPQRQYVTRARILREGPRTYRVEFADGRSWGPLTKC